MASVSKYRRNYKTWRYRLISAIGDILLEVNPIGWDKKQLTLTRNETYHAVFRSFSASLEYVRNGYDILKELEEKEGILAECTLAVDKRNTTTLQDTNVFTSKIDFSDYIESARNKRSIKVPLVDSTFLEKLKTREDIDIPFDRPEDLDGNTISKGVYTDITLLGREFGDKGAESYSWLDDSVDLGINRYISIRELVTKEITAHVLRLLTEDVALRPNFQNVSKRTIPEGGVFSLKSYDAYYYNEIGESQITLDYNILYRHIEGEGISLDLDVDILILKCDFDESGNIITGGSPGQWYPPILANKHDSGTISNGVFSGKLDITLTARQGIVIYIEHIAEAPIGTGSAYFDIFENTLLLSGYFSKFEPTPCKVVLPFEAFDYMATAITGEPNSFRSNVFGRTDIGYQVDGEYSLISISKGLLIRQFEIGHEQLEGESKKAQLSFKFKELFESYYKLKDIVIEVIEVNGKYIIVAEKKIELFSDEVGLTVGSIDKGSFERVRNLDMYYSDIEVGYQVPENDLVSGLEEYNNKETYSTIISNNQNKLDLINPYSASGVQIEKERRKPKSISQTEELAYDNTIFFIELYRNEAGQIVQRNEQGFTEINGLEGLRTKINLGLTPKQSLLSHGWEIGAGLAKYPDSKVKYNTSDKTTDLSFKLYGSDTLITENASEVVAALDPPKFTGFLLNFSAALSFEQFIILRNNTKKLVKVWSELSDRYIYGWIKEVSTEPVDKPTNWQLIEANPPDIATLKVLATDKGEVIATDKDEMIQIV